MADASTISGIDIDSDTRAVAVGDLNLDGRPDMVVRGIGGGPLRVFLNRCDASNSLRVTLRGSKSNSRGIGARLILETGDRELYREHFPQNSMIAQSATETIFGLNEDSKPAKLTIRWPSGAVQVLDNLAPGRRRISEPTADLQ